MNKLSLGSRFAIIAVFSTVLAVALLATTAYRELVTDFEDVLTQRQQLETETYASRANLRLQFRLNTLGALAAQLTDGQLLLPPESLHRILRRQTALAGYFDVGLVVFDDQSVAVAEDRHVPGRLGTSYADRAHFRAALASGEPYISRPIIGRTTGIALISFLYPIRNDRGDLLGMISGSINLNRTGVLPAQVTDSDQAVSIVLDTQHFTRVDSANLNEPLPDPGQSPLIDAALSGMTTGVVEDDNGQRWIYATRHLERVGWLFLRAVPYELATAPARASFNQFIVISLVLLAVLIVMVLALSRVTTRPLERMAANIRTMIRAMDNPGRLEEAGAPEIRSVARAFNRLMDEREALDELKNQFVANVSHELRTPLTSINGSLKLLSAGTAGALPDKARSLLDVALRNSEHLQRLIADLLDFNKALAGQLTVQPEDLALAPLLEYAASANRSFACTHKVTLTIADLPPLTLRADPHRVRQILNNYISNACKFSPAGSTVTLSAAPHGDGKIRLIVSDQGAGVPEPFLPRLFQRFAQAEAGSARANAGTGLGLAICRELAHLMDGQVGYYYQDGAHFWVDLPVVDRNRSETPHENT